MSNTTSANTRKYQLIGGALISIIGVAAAITLDESRYSLITLLGVGFILFAKQGK